MFPKMLMYCRKITSLSVLFVCLVGLLWPCNGFGQNFTQGKWFKIFIPKEGLQKLDYNWFKKNQIAPENISIEKIAIFIPSRFPSPETEHAIDTSKFSFIQQVPTVASGLDDQQFNQGDFLTFPVKFPYNSYSDSTFCLLNLEGSSSKWIKPEAGIQKPNALNYAYREESVSEEKYNFLQSGRLWVSEPFYANESKKISLPCEGAISAVPSFIQTTIYASSIQKSTIALTAQNLTESIEFDAISSDRYDRKAIEKKFQKNILLENGCRTFDLNIQFKGNAGSATVGSTKLKYPKALKSQQNTWFQAPEFQNNATTQAFQIPEFSSNSDLQVWLMNGQEINCISPTNGYFDVNNPASSSILLADSKLAFEPIFVEKLTPFNNKLASNTEMLIIAPKEYTQAANRFAQFKNEQKIPTEIRTLEHILLETTGGANSLPAIKTYLYQQKKFTKTLKYILLFSDASVDAKEKNALNLLEKKWKKIPTFESSESLYTLNSYASDDYLGILDDVEGTWDVNFSQALQMSLSIGRLPAKSPEEAQLLVNKLIAAQKKSVKTNISLIADDEDFNIHLTDAEYFAEFLSQKTPAIPVQKIYLDAFPMIKNGNAYSSPTATKKIIDAFNQDAGFIHFMGHGSENGWTDEKIFTTKEITNLTNRENLPLLLTATCQFAKFDNPYVLSGAEALLCSDKGGIQAIVGTSRPVFQSSNFSFGKNWYNLLAQNLNNTSYRLGDLVRDVKNASRNSLGNRNIILLGDPSSPLPWMGNEVKVQANSFTWGQANTIELIGKKASFGQIQLWLAGDKISSLGTKTPKFTFQSADRLIYQKKILEPTAELIKIPAIKGEDNRELTIRYQGTLEQGYQKISTIKQLSSPSDQVGPIANQSKNNPLEFILSDSTGIGFWGKSEEEAKIIVNDSIQLPLRNLFSYSINDKIWNISIDSKLLIEGENKIVFQLYDLLQNESKYSFSITKKGENDSGVRLFPNPFNEELYLQFDLAENWTNYLFNAQFFDLSGRNLYQVIGEINKEPLQINMKQISHSQIILCTIEIFDPVSRFKKTFLARLFSTN